MEADKNEFLYDRSMWLKAIYQNKVKRVHNPPKNYDELVQTLIRRFRDLRERCEKDPEHLALALKYQDDEGELVEVENSGDLIQAYRYAKKV